MNEPGRRLDPLAVLVLGGAAAVALGLSVYVLMSVRAEPAALAMPQLSYLLGRIFPEPEVPAMPARPPEPKPPAGRLIPEAGRTWTYVVETDPPLWTHPVLTYRTVQEGGSLGVHTNFRHAKGEMNFRLGTFAPNDLGHANTRFPGFFLYTAYIEFPLQPGQQLSWSWPWQLPGGGIRKGRVKRYAAKVAGWEELQVPGGIFNTVRIEATLSYLDQGKVHATAKETIWIAPKRWQVVRIVRDGATPDEGARRIVAQLLRFD